MEKATVGEKIVVFGNPSTPKDVLYVKDMAIAIADALESSDGVGLYNVSYDNNFSIFDLAKATAEAFAAQMVSRKSSPIQAFRITADFRECRMSGSRQTRLYSEVRRSL